MFSPTAPASPKTRRPDRPARSWPRNCWRTARWRTGTTRLTLHQGVEMGRPSTLRLTIEAAGGRADPVRIAGSAVRIGEGRIRLP
jgi:trans-2,3-dihydro-3-hydroxyanthranilate isomerase